MIEVLKQALEWIEAQPEPRMIGAANAITNLRTAIKQLEEAEPVAYVTDSGMGAVMVKGADLDDDTPLYTAPVAPVCPICAAKIDEAAGVDLIGLRNQIGDLRVKYLHWRNRAQSAEEITSASPAAQEGWLRLIDEELTAAHLGVANADDSYEVARKKLCNLVNWHCRVIIDPAVNGGRKLVPIEPTEEMIEAIDSVMWPGASCKAYKAMLNAAPEYGKLL